ncbi:hypothetical protein OS493_038197, partial [Desmophyllum pertusum]
CLGKNGDVQKTRKLYDQALARYYQAKEKATNEDDPIDKAAWRLSGVLPQKM